MLNTMTIEQLRDTWRMRMKSAIWAAWVVVCNDLVAACETDDDRSLAEAVECSLDCDRPLTFGGAYITVVDWAKFMDAPRTEQHQIAREALVEKGLFQ